MTAPAHLDGVRLLSHRPSVLFKLESFATEEISDDLSAEGVVVSGPEWGDRLRDALASLSHVERAYLFAVRLDDPQGLPLPAKTLLDRARSDWFPKFLSQGHLDPVFQPIVDLRAAAVHGREALIRGRLGKGEVRGGELMEAAEAHDALYSFDARARAAAVAAGLPMLPAGEILYVNLDPRAVMDVPSSLRSVWPIAEQHGGGAGRIGLEVVHAERYPDLEMLAELVVAHREQGASVSLDDLSAGGASLRVLERLRPDLAKLDVNLVKGIETSAARRRLVGALIEVAHEMGTKVVAVGIERDSELDAVYELDIDFGQGFYLGHPHAEMLPVDTRLLRSPSPAAT